MTSQPTSRPTSTAMVTPSAAPLGAAPALKMVPKWVHVMRWILLVGLWVYLVGILAQALLAGRFLFGTGTVAAHAEFGFILGHGVALLLVIISAFGRMGWKLHTLTAVGFVLAILTPIFPALRETSGDLAAIHPVSAILMFAVLLYVALRLRPMVMMPRPSRSGAAA